MLGCDRCCGARILRAPNGGRVGVLYRFPRNGGAFATPDLRVEREIRFQRLCKRIVDQTGGLSAPLRPIDFLGVQFHEIERSAVVALDSATAA